MPRDTYTQLTKPKVVAASLGGTPVRPAAGGATGGPKPPPMPSFGGGQAGPGAPTAVGPVDPRIRSTGGIRPADGGGVVSSGNPGGGPATPAAVPTLTNTGAASPEITAALDRLKVRTDLSGTREGAVDPNLQTQINRLGDRLSTDTTERAVDRATSRARDAAAGMQGALDERFARSGGAGGGVEGRGRTQISDAAARAQAKAAADIEMGELARKDALVLGGQHIMAAPGQERLIREGATDKLTLAGVDASRIPADLALQQQGLGIRQWEGQNNFNLANARLGLDAQNMANQNARANQQQMLDQWLAMMRASGY